MHHVKRVLCGLILVAVAIAPAMRAGGMVKPRIRAITGFITIDAKSYASQIQEAVTFLSQVRDAVKAAGYDVAGIRISTQPFPPYTRELNRTDAMAVLRGINDLATTLRFAPNVGPAMGDPDAHGLYLPRTRCRRIPVGGGRWKTRRDVRFG